MKKREETPPPMPGIGGRKELRRQLSRGDLSALTANERAGQGSDCTATSEHIHATDIFLFNYLFIFAVQTVRYYRLR